MRFERGAQLLRGMLLLSALAIAAVIAGCLADADRDNVEEITGGGDGGTAYYFDTDVAPLFDASCAISGCHDSGTAAQDLTLTGSGVYAAIVDQPSTGNSSYKLIDTVKGSADSYIYMKVTADSRITGASMAAFFTEANTAILADWIDQGAAESAP